MTVVIADTSPVNYLLLIGEIAILPRLYGQIVIPTEVLAELSDADAPPEVLQWVRSHPSWLRTQQVQTAGEDSALRSSIQANEPPFYSHSRKLRRCC